jgi:hypothetical protein
MNRWKRISSALSSFLTGAAELTPEQKAKLDEMEKDCAALLRAKNENSRPGGTAAKPSPPRQTL